MLDQEDLDRLQEAEDNPNKFVVRGLSDRQKLGATTVVCFILNRTIGSGIFILPATVLRGTDSIGISLLFWAFGALVSIAALLVWLELSQSIPRFEVDGNEISVPRSGGEKNYLEYIYGYPRFLTTCIYGVMFIVLGNLSGNAIGFGSYVMEAAGYDDNNASYAAVRGLAVGALTIACVLHAVWRKGGIWLNNAFAFMKVAILLLIIITGLAVLGGASLGSGHIQTGNFNTHASFAKPRTDIASYATSLLYALYPYTGFLQPFYVLSEVKQPRRNFARATIWTMIAVGILYMLVNIALYSVVPKDQIINTELDIATHFFQQVFGTAVASRVMSGIIALSIFGNIIVMTFTAARVKQEIAKEGILPFSRFFASNTTTLFSKISEKMSTHKVIGEREELEQSPAAGLLLHWTFSVLLVAFTAGQTPVIAYSVLVDLYTYVFMLVMTFFVSTGLLYLQFRDQRAWKEISGFKPWGGPAAAILVSIVTAFLIITAFIPPADDSPYSVGTQGFKWFIVPTVGLGGLILGFLYWAVFRFVVPRIIGKQLVVERVPIIVSDDHGGWVQKHEIVEFSWGVQELDSDDEK